jgi:hypothetical protein
MLKIIKAYFLVPLAISSSLFGQNFNNGFNFFLPSSDTTTQKFIPVFPKARIGDTNFVKINSNGKFSVNGKRIRFWGTNSAADAAFPSKDIAGLLAGRLRKFGFNLIRMHHLDNPWSAKSLLGSTTTRELDQANLDLLENYISALKENGIYVNMNLHVSRTFRVNDQVADYDSLPEFGKCVNFFDPYILQLHKEYAQQLLTHTNPYTGKALRDDPVMAMVEITNENSLYRNWRDNKLKPISSGGFLPVRYSRMLDSLWMDFLKNKYTSTAELRNAWNDGSISGDQKEQIINGGYESGTSNWILELHAPANGIFSSDISNPYQGTYAAKVSITSSTGIDWNIQFKQSTLAVKKDFLYRITFAARSDSMRDISVSLTNDNSPWTVYGGKSFSITPLWNEYTFDVRASEDNPGNTRLSFSIGKTTGIFWFDDVSITKAVVNGLLANESFESNNIGRIDYSDCVGYSSQRVKDLSGFYIGLQRNYFKEMISFLKNTLGIKVPIVGTNFNVGPADLISMSDADYVDNHAYWDHPQFPNIPGSTTDWLIQNKPMLKDDNNGTIPFLFSGMPMANKPFTVSEYNHPNPNQFQVESILLSAGYSAFNDADALMYFAYDEPIDWGKDFMSGYFGVNRNSLYMAFFPTAASMFRNGLVKSSTNPILVDYSTDTLYNLPKFDAASWYGPSLFDRKIGLTNAIKTGSFFAASTTNMNSLPSVGANPYRTDTGEMTWNTTNGTLSVETEKFIGASGYLSTLKNSTLGALVINNFPASDFGTVTWISLTDSAMISSQRSLITLGSKIQNTGMIWNSDNTSINDHWGISPTIIYPLVLDLKLNIQADSIQIFPLNTIGKEGIISPFVVKPVDNNHFFIELDQNKYKTLWFGIEKYGNGVPLNVENNPIPPREYKLDQNYPNPFNPSTKFEFHIAARALVTLKIYDLLGREIQTLVNEERPQGIYTVTWSADQLPSGIYFYRLQAGTYTETKKLILLK